MATEVEEETRHASQHCSLRLGPILPEQCKARHVGVRKTVTARIMRKSTEQVCGRYCADEAVEESARISYG